VRGLVAAGERAGAGAWVAVPARYGGDDSTALHAGLVARAGAVAATTDNTHGLEIAHLDAPERLARLLHEWLTRDEDAG
jgi:putative aminopeptidase FrvX